MDFFDKLGSKVGETFQSIKDSDATKKAINYAGIPALSVQIGSQEATLKKLYQKIGKAYYEAHKDDLNNEFSDIFEEIEKTNDKIEALKKEIECKKSYDPANDFSADVVTIDKDDTTEE